VPTKGAIAQFMKTLADEEHQGSKLVVIGINKAGDHLVTFGHDIGLRIDVFKMEANPDNKIEELINKGEQALDVAFTDKEIFCRPFDRQFSNRPNFVPRSMYQESNF
jgi:hypothetical protein